MNLHQPLHHSNWRNHVKTLQEAVGTILEENLKDEAKNMKISMQITGQIKNPREDNFREITLFFL